MTVLGIALVGAVWLVTHPDQTILTVAIIVLAVLVGLGHIFGWYEFLKALFK